MDKLAMRILKEQVAPKVEKLLGDSGIPEREFEHLKGQICMAKELLEIDCLLKKLGKADPEDATYPHNPGAKYSM